MNYLLEKILGFEVEYNQEIIIGFIIGIIIILLIIILTIIKKVKGK